MVRYTDSMACSESGCDKRPRSHGFCHTHYEYRRLRGEFANKGRNTPIQDRLMERIEYDTNGGCWLWTGLTYGRGYGVIKVGGRSVSTHRAAWITWRGDIPTGKGFHGTCICHRCDVRLCIRPDHLFLGTQQENVDDMISKGRCRTNKLMPDDIRKIRALLSSGETHERIATAFGVSRRAVGFIKAGTTWAHVH